MQFGWHSCKAESWGAMTTNYVHIVVSAICSNSVYEYLLQVLFTSYMEIFNCESKTELSSNSIGSTA